MIRDVKTLSYARWLLYNEAQSDREGQSKSWGDRTFVVPCERCPIDDSVLNVFGSRLRPHDWPDVAPLSVSVKDCTLCGWWQLHAQDGWCNEAGYIFGIDSALLSAILLPLNSVNSGPLYALRDHLHRHPERIGAVHPQKMEHLVADVFKEYFDCEVKHVGCSGDGGIDLLIVRGNEIFAVQVKRREVRDRAERVSTVRELVGAMIPYGLSKGKVVTTAERFGPSARRYVDDLRRKRFDIELVDCDAFLGMLNCVHQNSLRPWIMALQDVELQVGNRAIPMLDVVKDYCKTFELTNEPLRAPNT